MHRSIHTIPAGTPGWTTSAHNCGPLSGGGCHNGKTHANWHLDQPEPGRYQWTAPTGHTYQVDPETVGPILQRAGPPPTRLPDEQNGHPPQDPDPPPF
jgi:hypothetical protein